VQRRIDEAAAVREYSGTNKFDKGFLDRGSSRMCQYTAASLAP
jgi:hypothetical protein